MIYGLLIAVLVVAVLNLVAQMLAWYDLRRWIDAVGEMMGEFVEELEREAS